MAAAAVSSSPSIKFYTNRRCPWAHRTQITLKELGLPYEEITVDLDKPREEWYLKVNPRGLVPSISYSGDGISDQILTESAVTSQFLADAHPSHLTSPAGETGAEAALFRARVNFFVDTFFTKVNPNYYPLLRAQPEDEKTELSQKLAAAIEKEIEPLLADASPFFRGSSKLTLAEALTGPFVLRYITYTEHGLFPASLKTSLASLPNFSKWAAAVTKSDSVRFGYDEEAIVASTKKRLQAK